MIRKYAQNLLSRVKRSKKSVEELWLPKLPTLSSMWMNHYQFAGPLPVVDLGGVRGVQMHPPLAVRNVFLRK